MDSFSVLIVEDSAAQRAFMANICTDADIETIQTADNGMVALAMIEQSSKDFDILICDLEMPDLDGIELIHLLARRKTKSAVVIVSGREQSLISAVELMAKTEGLWVLDGVQKPLSYEHFMTLFKQFKQQKKSQGLKPLNKKPQTMQLETLQRSLTEKRFILHYQPKINMQSVELDGVEALVRLHSEDGEIIFPNDFIHQCESFNLIDELSYEVIRLAIEQKKQWKALGLDIHVSVNLSPASFDNEDFTDSVLQHIRDLGAEAKSLTFEVTETAVIKDIGKALSILTRLRLCGSGLSVDDYGTGYSSIKQLVQIPFTELKLDRCLVDGISSKAHLQVIFDSTLTMCNSMGLKVVAEGIEKQADWNYLVSKGCHVGQGYYYSPPMPADDFISWWQAGKPVLG